MKAVTALVLASVVALSGCQSMGQKETAGTLVGAGAGALAGSQFGGGKAQLAMTAIGNLIGATSEPLDRPARSPSGHRSADHAPIRKICRVRPAARAANHR